MTAKFDAFVAELRDLCRKHSVTLASDMHGFPVVYDWMGEPLDEDMLLDHTEGDDDGTPNPAD